MRTSELPSQSDLRAMLDYNEASGRLFWRHRPELSSRWNARWPGLEAFTATMKLGYRVGSINNVLFRAHRVCWKWWHGSEPIAIDHLNGIRDDNRIANLAASNWPENAKNMSLSSSNSSGNIGVHFASHAMKWRAYITVSGRQIHLGYFDDFNDAVFARNEAQKTFGFSARHGEKNKDLAAKIGGKA